MMNPSCWVLTLVVKPGCFLQIFRMSMSSVDRLQNAERMICWLRQVEAYADHSVETQEQTTWNLLQACCSDMRDKFDQHLS